MALERRKLHKHESEVHKRCMETKRTKCLNLSGLRLFEVPQNVYKVGTTLKHLYLHNCSLQDDFPYGIIHLPNLETLDLSQNKLTIIPDTFCRSAKRLKVLDVSYNDLYRLPGSIDELTSLREFNAAHNELIYIPSELGKLTAIKEIDLNSNQLLGLPAALFEHRAIFSLQSLDVSNNQLSEFPQSLGNVSNLKSLKLANNKLRFVPASLKHLQKVDTLYYGGNDWLVHRHQVRSNGKAYGLNALLMIQVLSF